ncbi:MAG: pectate lyase [Roseateles sp.]
MPALSLLAASLTLVLATAVQAAQIGVIPPAEPLTPARIAALPQAQRAGWADYLARSDAQRNADRAALAAERQGLAQLSPPPASGNGPASMPLDKPADWYAGDAARAVARNILSFQTPAGGWGKNQPRDAAPRQPGQAWVADGNPKAPTPGDFDKPGNWSYVGTIDNEATTWEIRFLARMAAAHEGEAGAAYRQAAERGLRYLLAAQYPNGGWPQVWPLQGGYHDAKSRTFARSAAQVWPLQGGYHDAITLNDNAMVDVMELLGTASRGEAGFGFLPDALRAELAAAEARAVQLLLAMQVRIDGQPTLWGQQHDVLTLAPTSARNYEPPALSSGESARALAYLMSLPQPSPEVVAAVRGGIAMLKRLAVHDRAWVMVDAQQGKRLVEQPGAGPLWSRYYDPVTLKPVFGDRDKTLHDDVHDISAERRRGYAWWGSWPLKTIQAYDGWIARQGG